MLYNTVYNWHEEGQEEWCTDERRKLRFDPIYETVNFEKQYSDELTINLEKSNYTKQLSKGMQFFNILCFYKGELLGYYLPFEWIEVDEERDIYKYEYDIKKVYTVTTDIKAEEGYEFWYDIPFDGICDCHTYNTNLFGDLDDIDLLLDFLE